MPGLTGKASGLQQEGTAVGADVQHRVADAQIQRQRVIKVQLRRLVCRAAHTHDAAARQVEHHLRPTTAQAAV
jgi:hypothetical protein